MPFYILLFFLLSCQTIGNSHIHFFTGSIEIKNTQKKSTYKIEVYKKPNQEDMFRVDILTPWNQVLLTYLWNNKEYLLIFPFNKKYYRSRKSPFKSSAKWAILIKNPRWFLQILNRKPSPQWNCDSHSQLNVQDSFLEVKNKNDVKKCNLGFMTVEWRSNKILFQDQNKDQSFRLHLKQKNISIRKLEGVFEIKVPSSFRKVTKILLEIQ